MGYPQTGGGLWATLRTLNAAGPVARLELADADGRLIRVELPRVQYEVLQPILGERLYLIPRRMRVFMESHEGMGGAGI